MQENNILFEYWDSALQQEVLHNLAPADIKNFWHPISRAECDNGKLTQHDLLDTLLLNPDCKLMVIIPNYAQYQDQYFFPYVLLAELDALGNFLAIKYLAMPIIPHTVLEPAPLCPISLGAAQDYDNYMVMQPAPWLETEVSITWTQQLEYAAQVLDAVNLTWRTELLQMQYIMQAGALIAPFAKLYTTKKMDLSILNKPKNFEIIEAQRNSGKSVYAKKLIVKAWLDAAIKHKLPPRYVWLQHGQPLQYASIFNCIASNARVKAATDAHYEMVQAYNNYTQGKALVKNWRQISSGMQNKYSDKGDIYSRLNQLHKNLKDIKSQKRHLEVLDSIWLRQIELIVAWSSIFDFIPLWQTRRLKRLYSFFKQNFPEDNIKGFSQRQLTELFYEKVRRIDNSERFIADTLHQAETDLHQESIVRDKCLQWCHAQQLQCNTLEEIDAIVEQQLWQQVVGATAYYWQQYFAGKQEEIAFLDNVPDQIDVLIVEHAEYVSPMQAAQLFAISKRCVIMGNYAPINYARFPVQVDYELTRHFKLSDCDADFEDLQFEGKLGSISNMWSLATHNNDIQQTLDPYELAGIQFDAIDTDSGSAAYLGSRMNAGTIELTLEWLRNNPTLTSTVAIYTCFSAQATMLQQALGVNSFNAIPVYLVQNPNFNKTAINLFLPVYSIEDAGPYVFDLGTEILDNLLANTTQRLIVIGDMRIFKPELHSAAGKFAKHFIKEEEVSCV